MGEQFVIDCAGRKVAVGDKRFAARCWVGNTSDFLQASAAHVIAETLSWLPLPKIHITVPIYRSGRGFLATLESLLSQHWSNPDEIEILLYVNQPPGENEPLTALTLHAIQEIEQDCLPCEWSVAMTESRNRPRRPIVRTIYEQVSGGLASVYQRSFSSLVARIRQSADQMNSSSKDEKVKILGSLMSSTVFAVVDDDLIFDSNDDFPNKLAMLNNRNAVVLGEVKISRVDSGFTSWDSVLVEVMNLFFSIKHDLGTDVLTPRAALLKDLFHLPEIAPKIPYSDQIWFAGAIGGKQKLFVPVHTSVEREKYPSNAEMATHLAQYLGGNADRSALNLFINLRNGYLNCGAGRRFTLEDIDAVISALSSREADRIQGVISSLLSK